MFKTHLFQLNDCRRTLFCGLFVVYSLIILVSYSFLGHFRNRNNSSVSNQHVYFSTVSPGLQSPPVMEPW